MKHPATTNYVFAIALQVVKYSALEDSVAHTRPDIVYSDGLA